MLRITGLAIRLAKFRHIAAGLCYARRVAQQRRTPPPWPNVLWRTLSHSGQTRLSLQPPKVGMRELHNNTVASRHLRLGMQCVDMMEVVPLRTAVAEEIRKRLLPHRCHSVLGRLKLPTGHRTDLEAALCKVRAQAFQFPRRVHQDRCPAVARFRLLSSLQLVSSAFTATSL